MSCPNRKNVSLVVFMGLPGSGKTTLSDEISKAFADKSNTLVLKLIYDSFVPLEKQVQFVKDSSGNAAKVLRKNFIFCVEYLVNKFCGKTESKELLEQRLSSEADDLVPRKIFLENIAKLGSFSEKQSNVLIIIDDNNYYHSMRNEFYQIAKYSEVGFCILYCKTCIKTCRSRNSERPQQFQVPDQVIVEMSTKLEEPNPMENSCDEFCFQIPESFPSVSTSPLLSTDSRHDSILPLILSLLDNSMKNPLSLEPRIDRSKEILRERKICSENAVHQADLILRKWVHTEMTLSSFCTKNRKDIKTLSTNLNRKKCAVIEGLKSGEIKLFADLHQDIEFRKEVISLAKNVTV